MGEPRISKLVASWENVKGAVANHLILRNANMEAKWWTQLSKYCQDILHRGPSHHFTKA